MPSGRLVAGSGGITTVQEGNGKEGAGTEPVAAKRQRKVRGTNRVTTYQITVGSKPQTSAPMVKVDGIPIQYQNQIYDWPEGETHLIQSFPSPVDLSNTFGPGHQYVFTSWSDGGSASHLITVNASGPFIFVADFKMQYLLTMNVNPLGKGSVVPGNGWYDGGAQFTITATANVAGYAFGSWTCTGNYCYQGNINPHLVTISDPITETANFIPQITITSNPTGTGYVIVNLNNVTTPQTYNWAPSSTQTVTAVSPVSCGTGCQYVFKSWSDGNTSPTRTITVPSSPTTYTANYQKQYLLTMNVSPVGSVLPGTSWHNSGVTVPLTASGKLLSEPRYDFSSWTGTGSGSYTGTTNHVSVTMNGPITETANLKRTRGKPETPTEGGDIP